MVADRVSLVRKLRAYSWDTEEWYVPLSVALEGVGPAEAAWCPPGAGNSIWQTVNHLNYYNRKFLCRLTGVPFEEKAPSNTATFGDAGDPQNADGWAATVARTHEIAGALREALDRLTDEDLDRSLSTVPLWDELASWLTHDAYHTGQIVMLRKQQGTYPARRG